MIVVVIFRGGGGGNPKRLQITRNVQQTSLVMSMLARLFQRYLQHIFDREEKTPGTREDLEGKQKSEKRLIRLTF